MSDLAALFWEAAANVATFPRGDDRQYRPGAVTDGRDVHRDLVLRASAGLRHIAVSAPAFRARCRLRLVLQQRSLSPAGRLAHLQCGSGSAELHAARTVGGPADRGGLSIPGDRRFHELLDAPCGARHSISLAIPQRAPCVRGDQLPHCIPRTSVFQASVRDQRSRLADPPGVPPTWWLPFSLARGFLASVQHTELDWSYGPLYPILVSPVFHRLHHSRDRRDFDSNYSQLFCIWDYLFGTANPSRTPRCRGCRRAATGADAHGSVLGTISAYRSPGHRCRAPSSSPHPHQDDRRNQSRAARSVVATGKGKR